MRKFIWPIVVFTVLIIGAIVLFRSEKKVDAVTAENTDTILFVGRGCPHCAKVEEYLSNNRYTIKKAYTIKEVYYNQENAKLLEEKARLCNKDTNSIGVPFLWDNGTCTVGDQPIIDIFKQSKST